MISKSDYSRILELAQHIDGTDTLADFVAKVNSADMVLRSDGVIQVDGCILIQRKDDLIKYFTQTEDIDPISYDTLINLLKASKSLQEFRTRGNRMLGKDLIHVYGSVVRFNSKNFTTRQDVLKELTSYRRDEYIEDIKKQCMDVLELDDGILLDGVAYLLLEKPTFRLDLDYPIVGYINDLGKPEWIRFKSEYFIDSTVDGKPIRKLYTLEDKRYKFYKEVYVTDIGVITKPYPVMLYENSKQCFSYKGTGGLFTI